MTVNGAARGWRWGLCALLLWLLAWGALGIVLFAFDRDMLAMQPWIVAALLLAVAALAALTTATFGWVRHHRRALAGVAAALLLGMLLLGMLLLGGILRP